MECPRYAVETLIQRQDQPWLWSLEAGANHDSLEVCDRMTMAAIQKSRLLPWEEKGFNPVTPNYLTVTLPEGKALLTGQEALVLSAAFPYARGRLLEPLSKWILINDLYGIPLSQPPVGLIDPDQKTVVQAAAAVIKATGADPKFVSNRASNRTDKARIYEVAYRPGIDPGPMRYVCRVDDCHAFGMAGFSFTTEEEFICHWNTFHIAVMPQFTCQYTGCEAVFAANPGALDRYLSHIERRRKQQLVQQSGEVIRMSWMRGPWQ